MTIYIKLLNVKTNAGAAGNDTPEQEAAFQIYNDGVSPSGPYVLEVGGISTAVTDIQGYLETNAATLWTAAASAAYPTTPETQTADLTLYGDSVGVLRRHLPGWNSFSLANVEDDFFNATLNSAWAWAGAPFITPNTVSFSNSLLRIAHTAATNQRAFVYRTDGITGIAVHGGVCSFFAPVDSGLVGVRLDDGDDSDYAEAAIRKTSGAQTWEAISRVRTGSGAVTTTVRHTTDNIPNMFFVGIQAIGTQWSNWGWSLQYAALGSPAIFVINVVASGLTWTPTRRGIIYENAATTDFFRTALVDKSVRT